MVLMIPLVSTPLYTAPSTGPTANFIRTLSSIYRHHGGLEKQFTNGFSIDRWAKSTTVQFSGTVSFV